jgi:light-regulated signal transduction histidine kinase (bacteriophytochrome)
MSYQTVRELELENEGLELENEGLEHQIRRLEKRLSFLKEELNAVSSSPGAYSHPYTLRTGLRHTVNDLESRIERKKKYLEENTKTISDRRLSEIALQRVFAPPARLRVYTHIINNRFPDPAAHGMAVRIVQRLDQFTCIVQDAGAGVQGQIDQVYLTEL